MCAIAIAKSPLHYAVRHYHTRPRVATIIHRFSALFIFHIALLVGWKELLVVAHANALKFYIILNPAQFGADSAPRKHLTSQPRVTTDGSSF